MNHKLKKFLEGTKLTAETITAIIPFIKMVLVAAAAFVVAMMINTGIAEDREQQYLADMRVFKEQSELASKYADSLAVEVKRQESIANAARIRATAAQRDAELSKVRTATLAQGLDSLRETITDSTEMARLIIPKQDSIIQEQSVTISKQDTTISNLNDALTSKDSTITLLTISRDSLQRVVNNIPEPPKPPMFPRITRKQVFVGGVIAGILLKSFVF